MSMDGQTNTLKKLRRPRVELGPLAHADRVLEGKHDNRFTIGVTETYEFNV
jgi:hypothetical protein